MPDKKLYCPICKKDLYITIENIFKEVSDMFRNSIKLKIFCKRCKKEIIIEI